MTKECYLSCRRNHCFDETLSFPNLYDLAPFEVFFLWIRLHTGLSIVILPLSFFLMVILHLQIQDCWCTVLRKLFWIWSLVLWPHRIRIDQRTLGVLEAICLKFQQNEGSSRECLEWKRKWQALKYTWLGRRSKLCVMSSLGLVCLMLEPKLTSWAEYRLTSDLLVALRHRWLLLLRRVCCLRNQSVCRSWGPFLAL